MKMFRKKGGFTLAEVLIVVALLAILTAVAAPNVAKYARSIKLRELDDSARSIFMAAEHKFMNQVEMGRDLPEKHEISSIPERYKKDGETPDVTIAYLRKSKKPGEDPDNDNDDLRDLMNSNAASVENTGVFESELLDNNYIIEYNPKTGDVYGVFYSEEDMSDYNPADYDVYASGSGDKLIGYYGLKNVKPDSRPEGGDVPKPTVDIKNREMLVLTIQKPEDMAAHVAIRLYQPDESDENKINEIYIVKRESKVTWTTGKEITIILDTLAPDSGKTELANAKELSEKTFKDSISNWIDGSDISLDRDISVEVIFYDETGIARDETVTRTFNPLFANGSNKTEQHIAYIEYGRHLQNLDKCSTIQTAVIRKTIDFSSKADDYEGWANDDVYKGRKFECLTQHSLSKLYGSVGTEIRYLEVDGCGLFEKLSSMEISNLKFFAPNVKSTLDYAGVICGLSDKTQYKNITIVNPIVEAMEGNNSSAGSLSGALYGEDSVDGCAVYVEGSEAEWNTTIDPFSKYVIKASSNAGGLVGFIGTVEIKNSYSAVKVKGNTAGGIVGSIGSTYGEASIENSFASGHTYYGIFDGTAKDGTSVNLRDNISGKTVGGIFGTLMGYVKLSGTVFSTCSVCGTEEADTAYLDYNKVYGLAGGADVPDGSAVYTLGTAYKDNGDGTFTEIKKSADTNVKTGDQVETTPNPALRYDKKVSGQDAQYKYPLPTGMTTMRGDWPTGDESVTGFFYWEKEGGVYHIRALYYGTDGTLADRSTLCKAQDGNSISESGYGAFVAYSKDYPKAEFLSGSETITPTGESENADLAKIIAEAIKAEGEDASTIEIVAKTYTFAGTVHGLITAKVNDKEYTFAPDFYAIYADSSTGHFGTPADTYGVRTATHLKNIGNSAYLAGSFEQSHDIVPTDKLTPIGSDGNKFKGTYDGGSYRILNATFNTSESSDYAGLFGVTENAKLENIVMFYFQDVTTADKFAEIKGKTVGVIVAKAGGTSGTIKNCVAAGYTVIGSEKSGGIAGEAGCGIEKCEANIRFGKIEGESAAAGGIVGSGAGIEVQNCYALIHGIESPKSSIALGGIVGEVNTSTKVEYCYVIFSGQTVGYPVANVTNNSTNYYVKERGYYQGNPLYGNFGTRKTFNEMKVTEKKEDGQISYTVNATEKDGLYELKALVYDNVAKAYVHYGPIPPKAELETETLTEGPLVGIFNVQRYSGSSGDYDGLVGYNRSGVLNWDEVGSGMAGTRHVGIFIANPDDPNTKANPYLILEGGVNSPLLAVYVNGEKVDSADLKPFGITASDGRSRAGYLHYGYGAEGEKFGGAHWVTDSFYQSENPGADANNAFMYYSIYKNGAEMRLEEIDTIEIRYENPDTKIKGTLLRAERDGKKSVDGTNFMPYIPGSIVDEWETPEMGAFVAGADIAGIRDSSMPKYVYPYSMKLTITKDGVTTTKGDAKHYYNNGVVGVVIRSDQAEEILNGNIKFQINSKPIDMVPWDEQMNADISNFKSLGLDGYEVFIAKEGEITPEEIAWGWPDFTAVYGSKLIFKYKCNVLTGSGETTAEDFMPDFVLATLYTNASGTDHYAKGFKSGAKTYPPQEDGSDNSSAQNPTTKTNSYVFMTTGSTSGFTIRINGSKFVDIGDETNIVTNRTWSFFGENTKVYNINILGDEVNYIEVYYKGELIMSKNASDF